MVNSESYVDRSARRASRAAWKQSQCVASGQISGATPIPPIIVGGGTPQPQQQQSQPQLQHQPPISAPASVIGGSSVGGGGIILPVGGIGDSGGIGVGISSGGYLPFSSQQSINNLLTTRSASALSHSQQSTVSISSGSVSSIPSSLATSGPTGNDQTTNLSESHSTTLSFSTVVPNVLLLGTKRTRDMCRIQQTDQTVDTPNSSHAHKLIYFAFCL